MRYQNDGTYTTRHADLAAFLRYALGDQSHISTTTNGISTAFVFTDEPQGRCRELADEFFAEGSAVVGDARALLESSREIKRTSAMAYKSEEKAWAPGDGQ